MDIRTILSESPLFAQLAPAVLDALAQRIQVRDIRGGEVLFNAGDPPGNLFILASGRLRAMLPDGSIGGDISRSEPIGEAGLLTGEPRGATVYAVRDSELLVISREDITQLIRQFPDALLEATRVMVRRLRQNLGARKQISARSHRSFAVVAATPGIDARALAAQLHAVFALRGDALLLDAEAVDSALGTGSAQLAFSDGDSANARLVAYLNELEAAHGALIYAANDADAWAQRSMRQADLILLVVDAAAQPALTPMIEELRRTGTRAHVEVVLLREPRMGDVDALAWCELLGTRSHYFVRRGNAADVASLARQVTGRGIGLVLGGGGARGFAHIGLMRALQELQIPIDIAGGSSMGAFFAALWACGHDWQQMAEIARDTYVRRNYLNDYLFPTVSMIRGRKFVQRLKDVFGDRQIEHLHRPYFCVSTNLTRGVAMVHDRGPLATWIATSMAVPGFAPPVAYKGELLADGAVINSLPTDVMQGLERGPIIASDVSTEGDLRAPGIEGPDPDALFNLSSLGKRPSLISIMFRTATLTSESGVAARAARADLYVRMPVGGIGLFDWKKLDEVVERGYHYALEKLAPAKDKLCAP